MTDKKPRAPIGLSLQYILLNQMQIMTAIAATSPDGFKEILVEHIRQLRDYLNTFDWTEAR